ncbi:hypothetical protein KSD_63070 [Ktedonobacter sp. SOSP1-85]|uniref:diguanylate cyclase n=1 Tax=Ktedonobacter sp. SOSP1-85 TaxID=2778367 RepID=UPI0019161170|nr:diguanylate cyclase [Ktedonobacter sp. SOSP1-85]GHO78536.1 hypothetical protein KSD_63070 [Ktedonobacter sp. SOSP1-85]
MLTSSQKPSPLPSLPAILSTRDLIVLVVNFVLLIDTIAYAQFAGGSALLPLLVGIVCFLLPSAFIIQWLTSRLSHWGSYYDWVEHLFGRYTFIVIFNVWFPSIQTLGGILIGLAGSVQDSLPYWLQTPAGNSIFLLGMLFLAGFMACFPTRLLLRFLLVACLFTIVACFWLGGISLWFLWHSQASSPLLLISSWHLNNTTSPLYGEIIFALSGLPFPIFLWSEVRQAHSGRPHPSSYAWWGAIIIGLCYLLISASLLILVPPTEKSTLLTAGQVISLKLGSGPGVLFRWIQLCNYGIMLTTSIFFYSRALFLLAQHRRLPALLARFNRFGVPIYSTSVQTIATACLMFLSFFILPLLFENPNQLGETAQIISQVFLASSSVLWSGSMIVMFLLPIILLFRPHRSTHRLRRERIAVSLISFVGISATLAGSWSVLTVSWIANYISGAHWSILILLVVFSTLGISYIGSESPRLRTFLREQKLLMERERQMRQELDQAYHYRHQLLEELGRLYQQQAQAALTDPVTGLPNHRAIMDKMEEILTTCLSEQRTCAILFVDLDRFKQINDRWGHIAGDTVLVQIGQRFRSALTPQEFVGRYGGEEFTLISADKTLEEALVLARRIQALLTFQLPISQSENNIALISVTASIGIALAPLHSTTLEGLLEYADQAMYQAKQRGRNAICYAYKHENLISWRCSY